MYVHVKTFNSAVAGARLVPVRCEKCACEYFYQLARIGTGSASAVYGIGAAGAAKSATEKAKRDLNARLNREAELVPCPNCDWINEELVQGHRLSRYRHLLWVGVCLGAIAGTASLIYGLITSSGPANARRDAHLFLIIVPGISVALVALIYCLRNWLRSRIQPNAMHPLAPSLPVGSPPALVKDSSTGQLEPIARSEAFEISANGWLDFQAGRDKLTLPAECCQCLGDVKSGSVYQRVVLRCQRFVIPFCSKCTKRTVWQRRLIGSLFFVLIEAVTAGILLAAVTNRDVIWILLAVSLITSFVLSSAIARSWASPVRIRVADAFRGVVQLQFRNEEYQRRLLAARGE